MITNKNTYTKVSFPDLQTWLFQTPCTPGSFNRNLSEVLESQERELESRRSSMMTMEILLTELNTERAAKNEEIQRLKVCLFLNLKQKMEWLHFKKVKLVSILTISYLFLDTAVWKGDCPNGDPIYTSTVLHKQETEWEQWVKCVFPVIFIIYLSVVNCEWGK